MIRGYQYQNAYVTRDLAAAVAAFKAGADVRHEAAYDGPIAATTPAGPLEMRCKLALLWVEDVQYEFIEPVSDPAGLYRDALPADDRPVFHHVAARVDDWNALLVDIAQQPLPIVLQGEAGPLRFLYLDTRPLLGHYLEYTSMPEAVWHAQGGRR